MTRNLLLTNARVITMDLLCPAADHVIIREGRISQVGSGGRREKFGNGYQEVDCRGMTVVPGFIDAHFHLHAFAESLLSVDLGSRSGVRSISDMERVLAGVTRKLAPGAWIRCGGYREFHLKEKRHPNRRDLDRATSKHPIKLSHASGYAHVLNSLALQIVGISRETPDPEGGIIDRDLETGDPSGVLYGMGDYLSMRVPPIGEKLMEEGVRRAGGELLRSGITAIQDASARNDEKRWASVGRWQARGFFRPRVTMMMGADHFLTSGQQRFPPAPAGEFLRPGAVKVILGETTGRLHPDEASLRKLVLSIHHQGQQAAIHALEERPIGAACTAIEEALRAFPKRDHRHRIEHCSVCPKPLADRLASTGITVVTQPSFIYYHGERYVRTISPSQLAHLYPLKMLRDSGVEVAAGSDCPIAPPSPLVGIYAAVSRKAESGDAVAQEQRIAPREALRMYTLSAARAGRMENTAGSISEGKLADLALLSGDPTTVSLEAIKDIRVLMTIIGGEIVWRDQRF